jgi:hypothetical protein
MIPTNFSQNMNKQLVKYNSWFPKQNHEVFVQCMLREPNIECKMFIPFPPNKPEYENELMALSVISLILLIVIFCMVKRK